MRIIYSEGFHVEERKEVRQVIFSNMVVAFKIIAEEMREIGMDYELPESHVWALASQATERLADSCRNTNE